MRMKFLRDTPLLGLEFIFKSPGVTSTEFEKATFKQLCRKDEYLHRRKKTCCEPDTSNPCSATWLPVTLKGGMARHRRMCSASESQFTPYLGDCQKKCQTFVTILSGIAR